MVEQLVAKFKNVVICLLCTNTLHLIKLIPICSNIDVGLWICSHVPTQITLHYLVHSTKLLPYPILVMEGILTNKSNYQTKNLYENYNRSPYVLEMKPYFSQREQFEVMAQKVHWNAM